MANTRRKVYYFDNMPSRKEIDLPKVLAWLDRDCPNCGYKITLAEINRISWDEIECPACHAQFDAGKARATGRATNDAKTIFKYSPGQLFSLKYSLVLVPRLRPLTLGPASEPFSHPDWLFEIKWDGIRSLVRIEQGKCRLLSRKGNDFKSFRTLNESLLAELKVRSLVLDGEIVCLNDAGKAEFRDLLFRQGEPRFVAFDLLWYDGQDLRYLPLMERKQKLRSILPASSERILYCDHVEGDGESLFHLACDNDLEGMVAKRKFDPYIENQASWLKLRNPYYSQWEARQDVFERERESDPDLFLWDDCVRACMELD